MQYLAFFFFNFFFCNFTEIETADDLLQWTITEVWPGTAVVGREKRTSRRWVEGCVFSLTQPSGLARNHLREAGFVDLTYLYSSRPRTQEAFGNCGYNGSFERLTGIFVRSCGQDVL